MVFEYCFRGEFKREEYILDVIFSSLIDTERRPSKASGNNDPLVRFVLLQGTRNAVTSGNANANAIQHLGSIFKLLFSSFVLCDCFRNSKENSQEAGSNNIGIAHDAPVFAIKPGHDAPVSQSLTKATTQPKTSDND